MNTKGEIGAYDDVLCIECGKYIKSTDEYHIIKRNKKVGGGWVHIHKACYEKLLPKNKSKKEVIL